MLNKCHTGRYSEMDLLLLRLTIVFIAYLMYIPRSCWAIEGSPVLYTKKTLALYKKLKGESENLLNNFELIVPKEDLKPAIVNSSTDVKIMLFDQGYLKVKSEPEIPGGMCKLEFPRASGMWLYTNLVKAAAEEDQDISDAISKIKTTFKRMPPEIDDFKSSMHSLEKILTTIPHLFYEWQVAAMFGTFYMCELSVTVEGDPLEAEVISCNDLPNNTCMRIVMDFDYVNSTHGWDDFYRDVILPGLPKKSTKNLLAAIASFFPYIHKNIQICDWYARFESPTPRKIIREYHS